MSREQKEVEVRFPPGAAVRLAAGGPVMVVDRVTARGRVVCRWFSGDRLEEGKFAPATLAPAEVSVEPTAPPPDDVRSKRPTARKAPAEGRGPTA